MHLGGASYLAAHPCLDFKPSTSTQNPKVTRHQGARRPVGARLVHPEFWCDTLMTNPCPLVLKPYCPDFYPEALCLC